jgi:hypothetical protein
MCLSKQRRSGSTEKLLLITGVRNAPVISQHKLFRLCINSTASGEPVVNNGETPVICMVQIEYGSTLKFLVVFTYSIAYHVHYVYLMAGLDF